MNDKPTNLVSQLVHFHRNYESWHDTSLSDRELVDYFNVAISKGRILFVAFPHDTLLGYVESWRINFDQLGRHLCGERFNIRTEDIQSGRICYLANVCIHPDWRRSFVQKTLKTLFFQQNQSCDYFIGEARRKRHAPLKIFKRQEFYDRFITERPYGKHETIDRVAEHTDNNAPANS